MWLLGKGGRRRSAEEREELASLESKGETILRAAGTIQRYERGRQGRHVQLQVQWQVQVQGQDTSEVQVSERCAETIRDFKTSGALLVKGRQMMRACKAMMRVPKQ